jgi:hypothetical protein
VLAGGRSHLQIVAILKVDRQGRMSVSGLGAGGGKSFEGFEKAAATPLSGVASTEHQYQYRRGYQSRYQSSHKTLFARPIITFPPSLVDGHSELSTFRLCEGYYRISSIFGRIHQP